MIQLHMTDYPYMRYDFNHPVQACIWKHPEECYMVPRPVWTCKRDDIYTVMFSANGNIFCAIDPLKPKESL